MNKFVISIISILTILIIIFFFLWRNESKENKNLKNDLQVSIEQAEKLKNYNKQKETEIKNIQIKYNNIVNEYKGNECENMKVSEELINALRELQNEK